MMRQTPNNARSRRAFLRGAGTVGVMLPFLEGLPERSAFGQEEDPRFGFFICGSCGVAQETSGEPERFWPTELGALSVQTMEADSEERCTGLLAEHADKLLLVKGINYPGGWEPAETHAAGLVMCLTGVPSVGGSNLSTSTGPSADWVIARAFGGTPLNLYAGAKGGFIDDRLSFSEAGQLINAEDDPYQTYLTLTGLADATGGPSAMANRLVERRKSVNDLVRDDLQVLLANKALSSADRQRLDLHLSSLREVEMQMPTVSCSVTGLDQELIESIGAEGYIEDVARLQMQLTGIAFSCNLTRAATLQWGSGTDQTRYVVDGVTLERFHHISHRINGDGTTGSPIENAAEKHAAIDRIRMQTLTTMLDHWSELSTPRGPLFQSAFAMWTCDVAVGPSGSFQNLPIIIAGSPGGSLTQAQYVDAGGESNARLLTSLIESTGADGSQFADQAGGLAVVES